MKTYNRKTIFSLLKGFCSFAGNDDFIEVSQWYNGEGFDVEVNGKLKTRFQLTYGEFDILKKLIKQLDKD